MQKSLSIKAGLPVSILAVCLTLSTASNAALGVPELVGLTAIMTLLSAFAVYAAETGRVKWSPAFILFFAALLRVLFLFNNPTLSDDLFRYAFDGFTLMDCINPYAAPPLEASPANPRAADLVPLINHGHLVTIYPPAAQLIFAWGAFSGGVLGMKAVLVFLDLVSCSLITGILKRLGLPPARVILYAWHPLPLLEIAGSGHIDGAAVCLTLLAISLCLRLQGPEAHGYKTGAFPFTVPQAGLAFLAGGCLAGAVLVKWIPLLFLPGLFFLVPAGYRMKGVVGFALTCLALILPFWPEIKSSLITLSVYLTNWEFAGFAFRLLREITGSGNASRLILAICGALSVAAIYIRMWSGVSLKNPFSFPSFSPGFDPPLGIFHAFYAATMVWLFTTPTLHPWYGIYLVFLLPFAGGCAGLVFSWSIFLSYRVLIGYHLTGQWLEDDLTPLLILAGPALAFGFHKFLPAFPTRTH